MINLAITPAIKRAIEKTNDARCIGVNMFKDREGLFKQINFTANSEEAIQEIEQQIGKPAMYKGQNKYMIEIQKQNGQWK